MRVSPVGRILAGHLEKVYILSAVRFRQSEVAAIVRHGTRQRRRCPGEAPGFWPRRWAWRMRLSGGSGLRVLSLLRERM